MFSWWDCSWVSSNLGPEDQLHVSSQTFQKRSNLPWSQTRHPDDSLWLVVAFFESSQDGRVLNMLHSWLFFACVGKLVKNAMVEKKISFSLRRYPNSNATPQQQVSHTCISTPTLPGSNKWPFQPQANEEKRTRLKHWEALGRPSVHPWQIQHQQLGCQIVIILHIYIYHENA